MPVYLTFSTTPTMVIWSLPNGSVRPIGSSLPKNRFAASRFTITLSDASAESASVNNRPLSNRI